MGCAACRDDRRGRALVLADNYQQIQAIALEAAAAADLIEARGRLSRRLEARGALHRGIEFLPDDKGLGARAQQKRGLTAPEMAVLLAYAKITLKEALLASNLPDGEDVRELLANYFPATALVNLARACGPPLDQMAPALADLEAPIDLDWLAAAVNRLPSGNRWQARARAQLATELVALRQNLVRQILHGSLPTTAAAWAVLAELKSNEPQDLAMLSAGLAEIKRLVVS